MLHFALEFRGERIYQSAKAEDIEYFHLLFDQHEIIFANGVEAESLYTGDQALAALDPEAKQEILEIFPEFAVENTDNAYLARTALKSYEALAFVNLTTGDAINKK